MEATYRAFSGRLILKFDVSTPKELFTVIGDYASVLDADQCCGMCNSQNVYPQARDAKKADGKVVQYYELVCSDCTARLSFGQHMEGGTLFAKRTDGDRLLEHHGWHKYLGLPAGEQTQQPRSAPRPQASRPAAGRPTATGTPAAAAPVPAELAEHLKKPDAETMGKILDEITTLRDESYAQDCWASASHNNPPAPDIIRKLFAALQAVRQEGK